MDSCMPLVLALILAKSQVCHGLKLLMMQQHTVTT
uniref:Uncharacterized protein n=1 Tax=Arundo donax TaxID=35708 RepID=A0A0A9AQ41_ARUDO